MLVVDMTNFHLPNLTRTKPLKESLSRATDTQNLRSCYGSLLDGSRMEIVFQNPLSICDLAIPLRSTTLKPSPTLIAQKPAALYSLLVSREIIETVNPQDARLLRRQHKAFDIHKPLPLEASAW